MADGIDIDIDFEPVRDVERVLERTGDAVTAEVEAAEKSKGVAEMIAPVRSGDYKRSFVIVRHRGDILLGNTDWKAHLIEWGTAGTPRLGIPPWPAHATLRRATRMAGYRLIENPRK